MIKINPSISTDPFVIEIFRFIIFAYNLITPFIHDILPILPILATLYVAQQARLIAQKSKDISEEKFDIDLFEKRHESIRSIIEMYNSMVFIGTEDIKSISSKFHESLMHVQIGYCLFQIEDVAVLRKLVKYLNHMFHILYKSEKFTKSMYDGYNKKTYTPEESKEIFDEIRSKYKHLKKNELGKLVRKYCPSVTRRVPNSSLATTSPASPGKPQPAAPAADQSPPKP